MRVKKDGALREAFEITNELNALWGRAQELRAMQAEAEVLYHALLEDEELLAKAREIAAGQQTFPSFQEEIDEVMAEVGNIEAKAKRISRKFKAKQVIQGWEFYSHSGGKNKSFTISVIRDMGYGDIKVGGSPLIMQEEKVDPKVFEMAVAQGLIDKKKLKKKGGYAETNRTRRTAFKKSEE